MHNYEEEMLLLVIYTEKHSVDYPQRWGGI